MPRGSPGTPADRPAVGSGVPASSPPGPSLATWNMSGVAAAGAVSRKSTNIVRPLAAWW
jgi:hypothetical protein